MDTNALIDWGGQNSVIAFVRGFKESDFQRQLEQFVAERAVSFASVCTDGSHPLDWTTYHHQYCDMYEQHFQVIAERQAMNKDEVCEYFLWIYRQKVYLDLMGDLIADDPESLYDFIEALASTVDYEVFLKVMFAEVRKQQRLWENVGLDDDGEDPRDEETKDVIFTVPGGVAAGEILTMECLGVSQCVRVPDGSEPGMQFQTKLQLNTCESIRVCARCGRTGDATLKLSKCKRCFERCLRDVCYCGEACQIADWPEHKRVCGKIL